MGSRRKRILESKGSDKKWNKRRTWKGKEGESKFNEEENKIKKEDRGKRRITKKSGRRQNKCEREGRNRRKSELRMMKEIWKKS